MALYEVLDISYWNGRPFPEYPTSGVDFDKVVQSCLAVILRIAYSTQQDERFEEYYEEFGKRGHKRGGYLYLETSVSAEDQADTLLLYMEGFTFELPVFIDVEDYPPTGWTTAMYLTHVWKVYDILSKERPDIRFGIYTRGAFWNRYVVGTQANKVIAWISEKNIPLWIARYTDKDHPWNDYPNVLKPVGWNDYDLWQYTEKADGKAIGLVSYGLDANKINPLGSFLDDPNNDDDVIVDTDKRPFPFTGILTQNINFRKTPNGTVIASLSAKEKVTVYDEFYTAGYMWYLVKRADNTLGWAASDWINHFS